MTEPSLIAQTITISHNVALTAGFAFAFGGFMIGYAVAWRQRHHEADDADPGWPDVLTLPCDGPLFIGGAAEVPPFACDCQMPPGKHPGFAAVSCGCPLHGDAADIRRGWA